MRLSVAELSTLPSMRRFIVTNPNLSVGRPGDIVTAEQLNMSSEAKLDEWVKAGHGVELVTAEPAAEDETEHLLVDEWFRRLDEEDGGWPDEDD